METFFTFQSKLDPFRLFSGEHLMTMAIILVLGILLFVFREELQKQEKILRFSLATFLFAFDVMQHIWLINENAWSLKSALPLHLSDLAVILAIVMLVTGSHRLFQFMYFAGLGSSIQAIVTPDLGRFSFPHFQYIEFFASHGGVVLACLYMVFSCNYRPTIRSMWVTILIINLYAVCVFFLNKSLNSNYLYIMKKPGNASLLDLLGPWPWYLIWLEIMMIVSFYLLYSPFWLQRKMERK